MDITYREATAADIDTLIRMRFAYLTEDHSDMTDDNAEKIRTQLLGYFGRNLGGTFRAVLGEDGGQVVATAYLAIAEKPANPAFITGLTGTVLNVFTQPEYRGRGIATRLMEMLVAIARQSGVSLLELSASAMGKPVYERVGFSAKNSHYTEMSMKLI